jgi:hypothetical protein
MNESEISSLIQKLDNLQLTESNIQQIQKNLTEYTTNKKQVKALLIALYNILTKLSDDELEKIVSIIHGAKHGGKIRKPRRKTKSKRQTKKTKTQRKYKRTTIKKRQVKKGGVDDDISDISSDSSIADDECGICLDTLEIIQPNVEHTKMRHRTGENSHYFHKHCIAKYVEMSNNIRCPTCTNPFSQDILNEVGLVLTSDDSQNLRRNRRDRAANILLIMTFVSVGIAVLVVRGQLGTSIFVVQTFFTVFRTLIYMLMLYLSQMDQRYITAVIAFVVFVFLRNIR